MRLLICVKWRFCPFGIFWRGSNRSASWVVFSWNSSNIGTTCWCTLQRLGRTLTSLAAMPIVLSVTWRRIELCVRMAFVVKISKFCRMCFPWLGSGGYIGFWQKMVLMGWWCHVSTDYWEILETDIRWGTKFARFGLMSWPCCCVSIA